MLAFTLCAFAASLSLTPSAMAGVVSVTGELLHFEARAGEANVLSVRLAPAGSGPGTTTASVTDLGASIDPGHGCAAVTPTSVSCQASSARFGFWLFLGDRDDVVTITGAIDPRQVSDVWGQDGDDVLSVVGLVSSGRWIRYSATRLFGGPGSDSVSGGRSEELIVGDEGADGIRAGAGNDRVDGGAGDDRIDGGSGTDWASHDDARGPVRVDLSSGDASGEGIDLLSAIENVRGSEFNDVLIGDARPNVLDTYDGSDLVRGGDGADRLLGGRYSAGADRLYGGRGDDELKGSFGADRLVGGPGHDILFGASGADRLFGRDGQRDFLNGGTGRDCARSDGSDDLLSIATSTCRWF
jgi:Ca2+-binding RTX toxin-like protein